MGVRDEQRIALMRTNVWLFPSYERKVKRMYLQYYIVWHQCDFTMVVACCASWTVPFIITHHMFPSQSAARDTDDCSRYFHFQLPVKSVCVFVPVNLGWSKMRSTWEGNETFVNVCMEDGVSHYFLPHLLTRSTKMRRWVSLKLNNSQCSAFFFFNLTFLLNFFFSFSFFLRPFLPPSPPGRAHRERMYGRLDVEDHWLRPGERVAQDHQDEHSRHLRLDGPRGHQVLHLLQGQRRLEVSLCAWMECGSQDFYFCVLNPQR